MKRIILVPAVTILLALCATARAGDAVIPESMGVLRTETQTHALKAWRFSLAPVIASQALDAASSYGMRELNPALAGPDGGFGMKAAGIKFGATAAILAIEYLIVRKHPGAARVFSKLNWSSSVVTAGFAAHNYAIR